MKRTDWLVLVWGLDTLGQKAINGLTPEQRETAREMCLKIIKELDESEEQKTLLESNT